jgi:integrase
VGRKAEYHIIYRKQRKDYRVAIPNGRGGREFIYGSTREEVLEELNRRLKDRRERLDLEMPLRPDMLLGKYVDHWLSAASEGLEPKTLQSYTQLLKGHVLPYRIEGHSLGTMKLFRIKRRHLKALISAKRKAGYAKDTVRLIRAAISTVLTDAVDDELIPANPALRLMAKSGGKEERKRKSEMAEKVRAMDGTTLGAFLQAARSASEQTNRNGHGWRRGTHAPIYSALFVTLAKTGLRPSEAMALLPFDLKLNQGVIRVSKALNDNGEPRGWTKTGLNRDVEMTRELADELRAHMSIVRDYFEKRDKPVPPMVFPSDTGTYLNIVNVRRLFRSICDKAQIQGFTPYQLRHTYASLMLMRGADPRYVQRQLGHESLSTTYRYYAHWIPKEARASYANLIELTAENPNDSAFSSNPVSQIASIAKQNPGKDLP